MSPLLDPPVFSPNLRCKLSTVSEAVEYIDTRLLKDEQNNKLIEAARKALYRAEDAGAESVTSTKLANALFVLEISTS